MFSVFLIFIILFIVNLLQFGQLIRQQLEGKFDEDEHFAFRRHPLDDAQSLRFSRYQKTTRRTKTLFFGILMVIRFGTYPRNIHM